MKHIVFVSTLSLALFASVTPSPGATLVVANKSDDTVDLIDLADGRSRATLPTGNAPHEVAVSPDGRLAVVTNYGERDEPGSTLTVIDVPAARVLRTIDLGHHKQPHGVVWVSARAILVTAEGSAHLLRIDVPDGELHQAVETLQRTSHMVAVTPSGRRAFVANITSGSVTVIDLTSGKKVGDVRTGAGAEGIAVTPDGKEVWVTNRAADTISVLDAESLERLAEIPAEGFPIRIAITPGGKRALVSCARAGEIALFDVPQRKLLLRRALDLATAPDAATRLFGERFGKSPVPVGLSIAPDGKRAWIAATQADAVVIVDTATLDVTGLLRAGREPDGMAWSPADVRPAPGEAEAKTSEAAPGS